SGQLTPPPGRILQSLAAGPVHGDEVLRGEHRHHITRLAHTIHRIRNRRHELLLSCDRHTPTLEHTYDTVARTISTCGERPKGIDVKEARGITQARPPGSASASSDARRVPALASGPRPRRRTQRH